MTYQDFEMQLLDGLRDRLGDSAEVSVRTLSRNNQVDIRSISVAYENQKIIPQCRLNSLYEKYKAGESIGDLATEIIERNRYFSQGEFLAEESVNDPERIRSDLGMRLINAEMNREMLLDMPHVRFLDLAVTFYYRPSLKGFQGARAIVHYSDLARWHMTEDELIHCAEVNLRRHDPCRMGSLKSIIDALGGLSWENVTGEETGTPGDRDGKSTGGPEEPPDQDGSGIPMTVLTSRSGLYGAVYMTDQEAMSRAAERMGEDFFLLPSSIHEVILVPVSAGMQVDDLNDMIREINHKEVDPAEVLSDHAYYYRRDEGRLLLSSAF